MTISTVYTPPQYTGNGVTTTFAFPYTFYDNTDLIVTSTVIATGVSTTLTLSDYSVTGGNGSTGSVILNTAPSSAIRITIERAIPYLQGSDFAENTAFPAETIERTFDKSVIMNQQVLEKANRAIRFPVGASVSSNDVSGTIDSTPRVLTVTSGGVATSTLGSITTTIDTVFTGLANGDFLSYDGANWVNIDNPTTSLLSSNNTFSGVTTFSTRVNTAKGADIASASTVNIGAATGNYIDITGTTTITAFDTVTAGAIRVLKFEGILTLTHNATSLILPTGANITTAVGDVAVFVSEGSGNWRCVSYTRADGTPLVNGVKSFTSTNQTITAAGPLTIAHGLGAAPFMVYVELECTSAEHNFSVGHILPIGFIDTSGSAGGIGVIARPDATNLNIRYGSGSGGNVFLAFDQTSATPVSLTNANWVARFKAVRF